MKITAAFSFCLIFISVGGDVSKEIPDYKDVDTKELLAWKAPEELENDYPYYLSGYDEDNSPIWISEMGKWDTRKSVESGPQREKNFKKYILQFLKRCSESVHSKSTSAIPVTEFNLIIDMAGYSVRQTATPNAIGMVLWMARQFEQAFGDNLKLGYIVNANFVFTSVWNLMKPILGANIYKIDVFGSNKDRWIPAILKTFPKSQIPA
ncbi:unnamed protein product, partial [Allacma fusca]